MESFCILFYLADSLLLLKTASEVPSNSLKDKRKKDWHFIQQTLLHDLIKTARKLKGNSLNFPQKSHFRWKKTDQHSLIQYHSHLLISQKSFAESKTHFLDFVKCLENLTSLGYELKMVDMIGLFTLKKITPVEYDLFHSPFVFHFYNYFNIHYFLRLMTFFLTL